MLKLVRISTPRLIARAAAQSSAIAFLGLTTVIGPLGAQATGQSSTLAEANRTGSGARNANALKQLDPADLAFWKNIRFASVSADGKWFAYQLTPNEGDAEVIVR